MRVYGEGQGQQNQLHFQMDAVRKQIAGLKTTNNAWGSTGGGGGGGQGGGGMGSRGGSGVVVDALRPASGRTRRTVTRGRPDGGEGEWEGAGGGVLPRTRPQSAVGIAGMLGRAILGEVEEVGHVSQPARGAKEFGQFPGPPSRFMQRDFTQFGDVKTVKEACEWVAHNRGRPGQMPSDAQLRAVGMSGLADSITRTHGGTEALASRLGLQIHHSSKSINLAPPPMPPGASGKQFGRWGDVEQAVLSLAQTLCAPDTMPSYMAMRCAGLAPLADAVRQKYGGLQEVSKRLGLQLPSTFAG